jgi:hypothetical protein
MVDKMSVISSFQFDVELSSTHPSAPAPLSDCHRNDNEFTATAPKVFDVKRALADVLELYGDSGRFERMPIVAQSAVMDRIVSLEKQVDGGEESTRAKEFIRTYGFAHHRQLIKEAAPPWRQFISWLDFAYFARHERLWQNRIFQASHKIRSEVSVVIGTDHLARLIGQQLERDIDYVKYTGPIRTMPYSAQGRPRGIEASVSVGKDAKCIVALDGKDQVTEKDVLKTAYDCAAARSYHPEYRWVQGVLVLPFGCDVKSLRVLETAVANRIIIATTALKLRPLGIAALAGSI